MLMPALFGWYAIRYFPALKNVQKLHLSACVLGIGLCVSGLVELITGMDVFPWSGSEPLFTETHVRRADGPFELQIVLSMVAILCFFFIIYLRRLMPPIISPSRAMLHRAGSLASIVAALLPLDRGLVLVLVPIAVIDSCSRQRLLRRRIWASFFIVILVAAFAAKLLDPRLYDDRVSNPDNFYQRVAQQSETMRVVREYPLFGTGLGLYHEMVAAEPRYMVKWRGIQSMTLPHNVVMTILSEEGIVGLLFYVSAQVFFVRAMWRIRRVYPPGWLAFLYCVLAYALTGLDFGTVYYSDINLFYLFVLGVLYQIQTGKANEQELARLAQPPVQKEDLQCSA
jgi:O-antigen ligase